MLPEHKTFDLKEEGRGPCKRDKVYMPKKCQHLKYVAIPALVAFILLCILIYVKLSGEILHISQNENNKGIYENVSRPQVSLVPEKSKLFNSNQNSKKVPLDHTIEAGLSRLNDLKTAEKDLNQVEINAEFKINSPVLKEIPQSALASAIGCKEYKDNCTLFCRDGSVSYIEENLNQFQYQCPGVNINLMVEKCEFVAGTLQQSFFFGYFSLGYLSINGCNLKIIKAQAFKMNNVRNLHTLILTNNQLTTLQATSFEGLSNLIHFEFVQAPLDETFKGEGFLKHLTDKLKEVIMQPTVNGSQVMDPLAWWQGLLLKAVTYLDLSNTNLLGTVNTNTFQDFGVLEHLILYNCNLVSITASTFDLLSSTLKYLDLRLNRLQTLDGEFLQTIFSNSIEINLSLNDWHCECDNEMLQYFGQQDVKLTDELVCNAPEKWQSKDLMLAVRECGESETSTIVTTTSNDSVTYSMMPTTSTTTPSTATTTTELSKDTSVSTEDSNETTTTDTTATTEDSNETTTTEKPTTLQPATTTSTEVITRTTLEPIITPPFNTITPPPILPPLNRIEINCYSNDKKTDTFSLQVVTPNANLFLQTTSYSSLKIHLQITDDRKMYSLVYFTNYSDYISVLVNPNSKTQTNLVANIDNLKPSTVYVFCVIMDSNLEISPFDCRSHFMEALPATNIWLLKSDKVWLIASSAVVALIFFAISTFTVYKLLNNNPQWLLNGNKRILPVHNSSKKVLIVSKTSDSESISLNRLSLSQSSSHYLKSRPPLHRPSDIERPIYSSQHKVPNLPPAPAPPQTRNSSQYTTPNLPPATQERPLASSVYSSQHTAPNLPPTPPKPRLPKRFHNSSCSPVTRCRQFARDRSPNMDYLDVIENDPDYQTIDHYEAIN